MTAYETEFLYDDFTSFDKKELEGIIRAVSIKPSKPNVKAIFLKRFTNEAFNAYRRRKFKKLEVKEEAKPRIIVVERPIMKTQTRVVVLEAPPKPIYKKVLPTSEILFNEGVVVRSAYKDGIYNLIEPKLEEKDIELLKELEKELDKKVSKDKTIINNKDVVKKNIDKIAKKLKIVIPLGYYDKMQYFLARDMIHFGKIDCLLRDVNIKEIICDGLNKPIRILYGGEEAVSDVVFSDKKEINELIKRFAGLAGKVISEKEPFLSAVLPSGIKIQASLSSDLANARFVIKK